MGQALTDRLTGLSAGNARGALLGGASFVVVAVAATLVVAGVASGEVVATVLFVPVFAAGFLGGRTAGYTGAAVATLVYVALRRGDLSSAGVASAGVLTLTRAGAYLIAGHVGALTQVLLPGGDAGTGAGVRAPSARTGAAAADRRRPAAARADATSVQRPVGPAWDEPWETADERVPALAGVGSAAGGYPYTGDETGYGAPPPTTTMSAAWPPEPPGDPWQDHQGARPSRNNGGYDTGGHDTGGYETGTGGYDAGRWDQGGPAGGAGGHDDRGWPGDGAGQGQGPDPSWQVGDEARPLADDSWAAVQQSWREQHGVPPEDDDRSRDHDRNGGPQDWAYEPHGRDASFDDHGAAGAVQPDPWGQQPQADPWADQAPGGNGWGSPAPDDARWAPPSGQQPAVPVDPWGDAAPTGGTWPQAPEAAPPAAGTWPSAAPANAAPWDAPPDNGQPAPWDPGADQGWQSTGQTEAVWDDPAAGHHQPQDQWAAPADAGWGAPGTAASGAAVGGGFGPPGGAGGQAAHPPLPAVDPETGLWTAKFLRDRLTSERARSRRSGRPFSMVLVQVPDGPLAQLPYRRQLTLLRELGYQFVAGGVVDHLVHVPDQAQHWFAVILPDTDRSGAQVLERRLRLGIGGYLSSRGLRLHDLESASLTAPDDDPAMGQIWEALIGPDEASSSSRPLDY